jgi:hypothetical protein
VTPFCLRSESKTALAGFSKTGNEQNHFVWFITIHYYYFYYFIRVGFVLGLRWTNSAVEVWAPLERQWRHGQTTRRINPDASTSTSTAQTRSFMREWLYPWTPLRSGKFVSRGVCFSMSINKDASKIPGSAIRGLSSCLISLPSPQTRLVSVPVVNLSHFPAVFSDCLIPNAGRRGIIPSGPESRIPVDSVHLFFSELGHAIEKGSRNVTGLDHWRQLDMKMVAISTVALWHWWHSFFHLASGGISLVLPWRSLAGFPAFLLVAVSQLDTPDSSGYSSKPSLEIPSGGHLSTWVSCGTLGIIISSLERRGAGEGGLNGLHQCLLELLLKSVSRFIHYTQCFIILTLV